MIFIHTTTDPASPFWLFHLESLTLARLVLHVGGPHLLMVEQREAVPDPAFIDFAKALEAMDKGSSRGLTMVAHEELLSEIPEVLALAPLRGSGFVLFRPALGLALGYLAGKGVVGPVWKNLPSSRQERSTAIESTFVRSREVQSFPLPALMTDDFLPDAWLDSADHLIGEPLPAGL